MKRQSNIQPLNLCVYRYPDNLELKLQKYTRRSSSLPYVMEKKSLKKIKSYSFSSFIPSEAPFVINIIKMIINKIENNSYNNSKWAINSMQMADIAGIDDIVKKILLSNINKGTLLTFDTLQNKKVEFVILLLRKVLKQFRPSLIHFLNTDLLPVLSSPLYDSTMRPNPKFNSVVKCVVLRSSRTIIDTAAFVMIHLFHVWEYSTNMQEAKRAIVQNLGDLVVSFECLPKLIDKSDISPQSCLLGIILETTNIQFWNSLTGHRVFEAFETVKLAEKQISRKVQKCKIFPEIPEIMKYDLPHLKMPINFFFKSVQPVYSESLNSETFSTFEVDGDSSDLVLLRGLSKM